MLVHADYLLIFCNQQGCNLEENNGKSDMILRNDDIVTDFFEKKVQRWSLTTPSFDFLLF